MVSLKAWLNRIAEEGADPTPRPMIWWYFTDLAGLQLILEASKGTTTLAIPGRSADDASFYMFYGRPVVRSCPSDSEACHTDPFALAFEADIVDLGIHVYPFDTSAFDKIRTPYTGKTLAHFELDREVLALHRLIETIYGNESNYLKEKPRSDLRDHRECPPANALVVEAMTRDPTREGPALAAELKILKDRPISKHKLKAVLFPDEFEDSGTFRELMGLNDSPDVISIGYRSSFKGYVPSTCNEMFKNKADDIFMQLSARSTHPSRA